MLFYDVIDIILNIWHWRRTIRQFKFIISRWNYYFQFTVFVQLSYVFPHVINRQVLKINMFIWASLWQVKYKFMWFIRFAAFHVCEYCPHAYIWTRIVYPYFLLYGRLKVYNVLWQNHFHLQNYWGHREVIEVLVLLLLWVRYIQCVLPLL